MLKSP